jgi:catechol 2,3-dioxygenase-like lactoylglutathione lyase family enzyme
MAAPSLHHVGYVVRDMSSALRRFSEEGATLLLGPTDDPIQTVSCALLRLADGLDVELVAPLDPESSPVTARLARGGGLDHVCLAVDDVTTALAEEEDRRAVVVCEPVHAVTFDRTIAFVRRRSGLLVELMAREPPA